MQWWHEQRKYILIWLLSCLVIRQALVIGCYVIIFGLGVSRFLRGLQPVTSSQLRRAAKWLTVWSLSNRSPWYVARTCRASRPNHELPADAEYNALVAEFQIPPQISRYASFLFSFLGRGIFYVFVGSIILEGGILRTIAGSIVGLVGVAYVVLEFVPSIEPPANMREADVGWGAEQV